MREHWTYRLGECDVTVGPSWVVTRFPDGVELHAHPNHDSESQARAHELGYEGVAAMTRDHDYLHSVIAAELGLPWSPTLWAVAHREPLNKELADYEERVVLARQKGLNER